MTLHEAIEQVLKESDYSLSAKDIASKINDEKLYTRKDGSLVKPVQIYARISHYENLFEIQPNKLIALVNKNIVAYKELVRNLSDYLLRTSLDSRRRNFILPTLIFLVWSRKENFKSNKINTCEETLFKIYNEIAHNPLNITRFPGFDEIFYGLRERDFENLFGIIDNAKINDSSESEFGSFFNDLINDSSWRGSFRGDENSSPKELGNFIAKISKVEKPYIITDPYARHASLLLPLLKEYSEKETICYAQDENIESIWLGTLNLIANDIKIFQYFNSLEVIENWKSFSSSCIISTPPFGGKLKEPFIGDLPNGELLKTSDVMSVAIFKIATNLLNNGRAYVTVPIGFLFRQDKSVREVRKYLIKEQLLTGIITLPTGLFKPYSGVSTVLLVIDKQKGNYSKGLLHYDLSSIDPSDILSRTEEISNLLYSTGDIENGENHQFVNYIQIEQNQFRFEKNLYFQPINSTIPFRNENTVRVKSCLNNSFSGHSAKTTNLNDFEGIPYVQVSDLSATRTINELDIFKVKRFVSDIELLTNAPRYISYNSILVAKVGLNLKPTLFKSNEKVLCSNNIIVLEPNPNILPEYLVAILQDEYFVEQINLIRNISGLPNFRLSEFVNLDIFLPSLELQQEYINQFFKQELQDKIGSNEKAESDDLYNIISRINHELMSPVSSLGMDIKLIKDFLVGKEKKSSAISLQEPLITLLPGMEKELIDRSKLESVLDRMMKCQKDSNETLVKAEETLRIGISSFNAEKFNLKDSLKEELFPIYENANCNIKLFGEEQYIKGDKYQLKVLFKNLIDNAIKHGFGPEKLKVENIINIHLMGRDNITRYNEIIVENNGKSFPAGFDLSTFETRGTSDGKNKGTGFGGYHIKKVIENHKGIIKIARQDEVKYTDFKVKFLINLPE